VLALARAAVARGASIHENCAVRSLETEAGNVAGGHRHGPIASRRGAGRGRVVGAVLAPPSVELPQLKVKAR
jgi:hypothetical protein